MQQRHLNDVDVAEKREAPVITVMTDQLRRPVPGGIGTYVRGLLQGLCELGVDVNTWDGAHVPSRILPRITRFPVALNLLMPATGVVHATSLVVPPRKTNRYVSTFIHDLAWREMPEAFTSHGRAWHEAAFRAALSNSDLLLVPAETTMRALVREGVDPETITVTGEGWDHLAAPRQLLLSSLGIRGDYFLSVGTAEPRKNLPRLFDAYKALRVGHSDAPQLVVVGPQGWGDNALEETTLSDGIVFGGRVDDDVLSALYRNALALVFPSLHEGFGLPVLEAMGSSCAVITGNVPAGGDAALRVDVQDVVALTVAMNDVWHNVDLRKNLVARGADHAKSSTWRTVAQKHVDVWEKMSTTRVTAAS